MNLFEQLLEHNTSQVSTVNLEVCTTEPKIQTAALIQSHDEQPLTMPHDPLVLSCASYRLYLETGHRWHQLESCTPIQQDRDQAEIIRKMYSERVLMRMLKNDRVSQYQRDLYDMLVQGARHKHLGILYRLPYFYHEDQQREQLQSSMKSVPEECVHEFKKNRGMTFGVTLTPVTRILRSRRSGEMTEFWFTQDHGYAVNWSVDVKNPLFSMVDGLYARASFKITCMIEPRNSGNFAYLAPINPQLA